MSGESRGIRLTTAGVLVAGVLATTSAAGGTPVTERVSDPARGEAFMAAIDGDGSRIAYQSGDILVRDMDSGALLTASRARGGGRADGESRDASISANGRFVAFRSEATNLVAGDTNGVQDVFVRDLATGRTDRVNLGPGGTQANGESVLATSISADGRFVAFTSAATNLVPGDTNGFPDVFVRDRALGRTERVSVGAGGTQAHGQSDTPSISADGQRVAFVSEAGDLVVPDRDAAVEVYVRDRAAGTTLRVSLSSDGIQGDRDSFEPRISGDGRFVVFASEANNLVRDDDNVETDVFRRDLLLRTTERVSETATGGPAGGASWAPAVDGSGRHVAFATLAPNIISGDTNDTLDVVVRDMQTGLTERASVTHDGAQASAPSGLPSLSGDGRYVALQSQALLTRGGALGPTAVYRRGPLASPGQTCAPAQPAWARPGQAVSLFAQGPAGSGAGVPAAASDPRRALNRPQPGDGADFVSLGFTGRIVVCFARDVAVPANARVRVWETTPATPSGAPPEAARVEVSSDGSLFRTVGTSHAADESFRLPDGMRSVRAVRITDVSERTGAGPAADGFDLDAVVIQTREGARLAP